MKGMRLGQDIQVVPLLASVATTAGLPSAFVKANLAHFITFSVYAITDTTTTVTVEVCTANSTSGGATEDQIAFYYRLSAAQGTDTWGAVTSASTAGASFTGTGGGTYCMLIDVDPRALPDGYNYVRVVITAGSNYSAVTRTVLAYLEPRYAQHYIDSSS